MFNLKEFKKLENEKILFYIFFSFFFYVRIILFFLLLLLLSLRHFILDYIKYIRYILTDHLRVMHIQIHV